MSEQETYGHPTSERQRRRKGLVTMAIVVLLLFFAAWYAFSYFRADAERAPAANGSNAACRVVASEVEINVYNATTREGLAGRVAEELEGRGFQVKEVENYQRQETITGNGWARFGPAGAPGATTLSQHARDFEQVEIERERPVIDLVLGPDFTALAPAEDVPEGC